MTKRQINKIRAERKPLQLIINVHGNVVGATTGIHINRGVVDLHVDGGLIGGTVKCANCPVIM